MKKAFKLALEGCIAIGGGIALLMAALFVIFFLQDAPKQAGIAQEKIGTIQVQFDSMAREASALRNQVVSGLRVVHVLSTDPKFTTRIVIQTERTTQPTTLTIEFDKEASDYRIGSACFLSRSGSLETKGEKFVAYRWNSPPFTPECPLILDIAAALPVRVIGTYLNDH